MTTAIACIVDETGISAPTFAEVLTWLQAQFQTIYGIDIVLDADTQDGQLCAIFADAINDQNMTAVAVFNGFRPQYAVGAGLSSIVKINGIRRRVATQSSVILTVGGTVGTVIRNAYVGDNLNLDTTWFIAGPVTIPAAGVIDTQGLCTTFGAVTAAPGTITEIATEIPGWQTVTNNVAASPGAPIETDAQLRRRQTLSTSLPALTTQQSLEGNLLTLDGVTRARTYQNDTLQTDANGIPARSIAVVVEGGDPHDIAQTISRIKAPGVPTYGSLTEVVYDRYGVPNQINFFPLTDILVSMVVFLTGYQGYTDTIAQYVQRSMAQFCNDMQIGAPLHLGDIYSPANLDGDAAIAATGLSQTELDPLGRSFNINAPFGIALARPEMAIIGGPWDTGAAGVNCNYGGWFTVGETIYITMQNNSLFQTVVTSFGSNYVFFDPPLPSTTIAGRLIYAVGDLPIRFNEAAVCNWQTSIILTATGAVA